MSLRLAAKPSVARGAPLGAARVPASNERAAVVLPSLQVFLGRLLRCRRFAWSRLWLLEGRKDHGSDAGGAEGYRKHPPLSGEIVGGVEGVVERVAACGGPAEREADADDQEIELVTAVRGEEAVLPVDDGDRVQHHDRDPERREWGQQAEREANPAEEFRASREHRHRERRTEALAEEPCGSARAAAAEPAEQLLGAVRRHDDTDG